MHIQFHKSYLSGQEKKYIEDILTTGDVGSDGKYTKLVTKSLSNILKTPNILLTTSCTHSLELAMQLIQLREDDEVIMPTYTFPSTANAVLLQKAKVVFTEVNEEDLNIDVTKIEEKITSKTKAIIVVHYGGSSCDMDTIMDLASQYNLYVIEDAAQGLGSTYKGKPLGTIGHIGCFSFHSTKNVSCGEGGAISINYNHEKLLNKANVIRDKGTNRVDFINNHIDYYQWVNVGSSYTPSELLMAFLYGQLENFQSIHKRREEIFMTYYNTMERFKNKPYIKSYSKLRQNIGLNYHLFFINMDNNYSKELIKHLNKAGISAYTHFVPLHMSLMGKQLGYKEEDFKKETMLAKNVVRLPLYPSLSDSEVEYINNKLEEFFR